MHALLIKINFELTINSLFFFRMPVQVAGLGGLSIDKYENGYWTSVDSVYKFVKDHRREGDEALPRKDNIKRKLKSYTSDLQNETGPIVLPNETGSGIKDLVPLSSVIRFMVDSTDK